MYPRRPKPVLAKAKCNDRAKDAADDFNDNNMGTGSFSYDASDDPTTNEESGDMTFCMSNYAKESMKMMFMMRSHHMLTDVVLEVKQEQFHAHKIVLSAASPYFKAMFTGGLKESEMSRVRLQGVCPTAMGRILYFMYSGHIRITELTVCQLLPAATMFQVPNVIDACCAFLERQLDPTNVIGIASFAEQHGCTKLKQSANAFIERHFTQICHEEEFLQLSAIQLIQLIIRDELNVQEEREVYNAVLKWVKYDEDTRYPKMVHILHAVRCQFLTPNFLKEQMSNCDVLKKVPACREYLASIFKDLTLHKQPLVNERKPNTTRQIFISGGYYRHSLDILEAFNVDDQTWTAMPSLRVPRSGLGAAFLRGQFYAVGGRNNSPGTAYDSDWVDRFDPVTEEWRPCAPMTLPRNRVGVAVMDELLYAVGGSAGTEYHDSVEHYEPDFDRWTRVAPMHYKRLGVGIAIVNRMLYAIGGFNGKERLKSCECYHPENNEWTVIAPMNVGRSGAGVAALNQYIYVVGGFDGARQLNSVERYDTESGVWEIQTGIDIARSALALNVLDGKLYAMGGFDGQNFLSIVEVYDPVLNKWDEGTPLTTGRSGHASAVIYTPSSAASFSADGQAAAQLQREKQQKQQQQAAAQQRLRQEQERQRQLERDQQQYQHRAQALAGPSQPAAPEPMQMHQLHHGGGSQYSICADTGMRQLSSSSSAAAAAAAASSASAGPSSQPHPSARPLHSQHSNQSSSTASSLASADCSTMHTMIGGRCLICPADLNDPTGGGGAHDTMSFTSHHHQPAPYSGGPSASRAHHHPPHTIASAGADAELRARQQMPPPASVTGYVPPAPSHRQYSEPSLTYVAPSQQHQYAAQQQQSRLQPFSYMQHTQSDLCLREFSSSSGSSPYGGAASSLGLGQQTLVAGPASGPALAMMAHQLQHQHQFHQQQFHPAQQFHAHHQQPPFQLQPAAPSTSGVTAAAAAAASAGGSTTPSSRDKKRLRVHSFNSCDALPAKIPPDHEAMCLDDDDDDDGHEGGGGGDYDDVLVDVHRPAQRGLRGRDADDDDDANDVLLDDDDDDDDDGVVDPTDRRRYRRVFGGGQEAPGHQHRTSHQHQPPAPHQYSDSIRQASASSRATTAGSRCSSGFSSEPSLCSALGGADDAGRRHGPLPVGANPRCPDGCTVTQLKNNLQRRFRQFVQGRRPDGQLELVPQRRDGSEAGDSDRRGGSAESAAAAPSVAGGGGGSALQSRRGSRAAGDGGENDDESHA